MVEFIDKVRSLCEEFCFNSCNSNSDNVYYIISKDIELSKKVLARALELGFDAKMEEVQFALTVVFFKISLSEKLV